MEVHSHAATAHFRTVNLSSVADSVANGETCGGPSTGVGAQLHRVTIRRRPRDAGRAGDRGGWPRFLSQLFASNRNRRITKVGETFDERLSCHHPGTFSEIRTRQQELMFRHPAAILSLEEVIRTQQQRANWRLHDDEEKSTYCVGLEDMRSTLVHRASLLKQLRDTKNVLSFCSWYRGQWSSVVCGAERQNVMLSTIRFGARRAAVEGH